MASKEDEAEFRGAVEVIIAVAEKLAPFCSTVEEMIFMLQHGLDNPAQLKLLMSVVKPAQGTKR